MPNEEYANGLSAASQRHCHFEEEFVSNAVLGTVVTGLAILRTPAAPLTYLERGRVDFIDRGAPPYGPISAHEYMLLWQLFLN